MQRVRENKVINNKYVCSVWWEAIIHAVLIPVKMGRGWFPQTDFNIHNKKYIQITSMMSNMMTVCIATARLFIVEIPRVLVLGTGQMHCCT